MQISVVIVNWNTAGYLRACLDSLPASLEDLEYETIVVDNASSDGSAILIEANYPDIHLITCPENLGFGQANNLAIQQAAADYLLLLNPDTILHPGAAKGLFTYIENHPDVGAVGPRVLNTDGSLQISISPRPTLGREAWRLFHLDLIYPLSMYPSAGAGNFSTRDVDVLKGACLLVRKKVLNAVGLFDEQFFVYSEEVDLCLRIQKSGWRIVWLPGFTITHFGGESTSQVADQMFIELYRNKVRFFRKHGSKMSPLVYKVILFLAALVRWVSGTILKNTSDGKKRGWGIIARQYRDLITHLPGM